MAYNSRTYHTFFDIDTQIKNIEFFMNWTGITKSFNINWKTLSKYAKLVELNGLNDKNYSIAINLGGIDSNKFSFFYQ